MPLHNFEGPLWVSFWSILSITNVAECECKLIRINFETSEQTDWRHPAEQTNIISWQLSAALATSDPSEGHSSVVK